MVTAVVTPVVLGVAAVACAFDVGTRRIPNLLTFGAAAAALLFAAGTGGPSAAAASLGGWAVGLLLFLPLFLLGGMGAGDVKLLAALGAWLGPGLVLWVALYGAIAGGLLALVVALSAGYLRTLFSNLGLLLTHWRVNGVRPLESLTLAKGRGPRLPYALPIAVGLLCTLWLK